jgi:hypothetical protein
VRDRGDAHGMQWPRPICGPAGTDDGAITAESGTQFSSLRCGTRCDPPAYDGWLRGAVRIARVAVQGAEDLDRGEAKLPRSLGRSRHAG